MTTYFVETADIPFKIDWDNPVESRLLRLVDLHHEKATGFFHWNQER